MRLQSILQITVLSLASACASAQAYPGVTTRSLIDAGVSYDWTHANAPAGQCSCFSMNGAHAVVTYNLPHRFSIVADVGGNHASSINGTDQTISVYTYLFGGRYTVHTGSRLSFYGQALAGTTYENSNYAYVADREAFTFGAGGGALFAMGSRFSLNLVEADWIHSNLPNASNDRQNDLRLGAGVLVHFGSR